MRGSEAPRYRSANCWDSQFNPLSYRFGSTDNCDASRNESERASKNYQTLRDGSQRKFSLRYSLQRKEWFRTDNVHKKEKCKDRSNMEDKIGTEGVIIGIRRQL